MVAHILSSLNKTGWNGWHAQKVLLVGVASVGWFAKPFAAFVLLGASGTCHPFVWACKPS